MEITCLIPTRGERSEMLSKALASIDVTMDIKTLVNDTGWLQAFNEASADIEGSILLAGDDMEFYPGAIAQAIRVLELRGTTDLVVGFNQANLSGFCQAGFVLIGEDFRKRFRGKGVYCPDFKHYYADTELLKFAKKVGKFFYCETARVNHWHFSVTGERDNTSKVSGVNLERDKALFQERRDRGLLWGQDFNLIAEEKEGLA